MPPARSGRGGVRSAHLDHGQADRGPALYAVSTSGDRVAVENLYQHAEHYFRIMNAANEGHQHCVMSPTAAADLETKRAEEDGSEMAGPVRTSLSNRQPYSAHRVENGAGRHTDAMSFSIASRLSC